MLGEILVTSGPQKGERFEISQASVVHLSQGKLLLGPMPDRTTPCVMRFVVEEGQLCVEAGGRAEVEFNQRLLDKLQPATHGDMVTVGDVGFVFSIRSARSGRKSEMGQRKHHVLSRVALRDVSSVVNDLHAHRTHLAAFYRIVSEIHLGISLDNLMGRILDVLLEELPAAQRAVIFRVREDGELTHHLVRSRGKDVCPTRISHSLLDEVVSTREAILSRDLMSDDRFKTAESIVIEQMTTAICAPFFKDDEVVGAILVDSTTRGQPFGKPDLELVTAVAGQLALAMDRRRLLAVEHEKKSLEANKQAMDQALVEAMAVQQFLLPSSLPKILGCQLSVRSEFCEKLGGDYYDLFALDAYRMAVVVADVSGHSISSALVMAMTRSIVRCYCQRYENPSQVLAETNRAVRNDTRPGMFVTLFLGFLNTREMTLSFANAGHHYPILFESGTEELRQLDSGGFPLGLRADATYPLEKIYLKGGDFMVFYTDGVVEAKDPTGRMFGKEGMLKPLQTREHKDADSVASAIYNSISIHLAGHQAADDISILTLSVDPAYDSLFFEVPSLEEKAEEAARIIAAYSREHGFLPERREAHFRLMMREASANAITHGNKNNAGKKISYYVRSDSEVMRISVMDEGQGFSGNARLEELEIDTRTLRGRGLFLLRKYADGMSYNECGNELILDFQKQGFGNPEKDSTT